ncbi:VOC family protein [Pseudogemmobacter blasticus]|uniref:VOC family protein n=1 Tax=Fuscovulum blasticum DSM 2131 TaxID=1188250 RepID=A0A2T4J886_FUSBL|nr:VOC family protein [Fuscovulum blasticum]PTE14120.1 VOC family protein [Fuscovulum blasticum DSM 2131]
MPFDPYLHFQGNCRAAMTAYQAVFGGELQLMGYGDAPDATAEMKASDGIMHGMLLTDGRMLLASDFPPGFKGDPQQAVSVSHIAGSVPDAKRVFAALAEGGEVIMEFAPTFWSDGFGMLKDRFGTHWMISAPWRQG